jgi:hypothetical protein
MSILDDGIIHDIRDLIRKWRGLPRFGYRRWFKLSLGRRYRRRIGPR